VATVLRQLAAVSLLPTARRKTGQQLTQHGDTDQNARRVLQHGHDACIPPLECGVGIGIDGDGAHGSVPLGRVNLGKSSSVVREGRGVVVAPRSCQSVQVVKLF
jgi:hypothetical protein